MASPTCQVEHASVERDRPRGLFPGDAEGVHDAVEEHPCHADAARGYEEHAAARHGRDPAPAGVHPVQRVGLQGLHAAHRGRVWPAGDGASRLLLARKNGRLTQVRFIQCGL